MITMKIQVFSKEGTSGMHLEIEPYKDVPACEVKVAQLIVKSIKAGLLTHPGEKSRIIETTKESVVNEALKKEFGLDG